MGGSIKVVVIDDHPLFREGVAAVLHIAGDFDIVAQGAGSDQTARLIKQHAPDVVVLDLAMAGDGLATLKRVVQTTPSVRVVVLTTLETEDSVSTAMKAGASAYVLKGVSGNELARIVREIHAGARYVDPTLAARILAQQSGTGAKPATSAFPELTCREGQIVGQVARGLTNKEVARVLTLSEKTVKHYMTSIMQKMQVRNRTELVLVASAKYGAEIRRVG